MRDITRLRRRVNFVLVLLVFTNQLIAQGKAIDFPAIEQWSGIDKDRGAISNNGAYFIETIDGKEISKLILRDTSGSWNCSFENGEWLGFSDDSRSAVVRLPGDSLCLLKL